MKGNKKKAECEKTNRKFVGAFIRTRSQKGITLIALIITIIVMLILVGVTINVALNGGLFNTSRDSVSQIEKQSIYEQIIMGMKLDGGKIKVEETYNEARNILSEYTVTQTSNGIDYIVLTVKGKNGTYTYTITNEKIVIGKEIPTPEIGQVNNESGEPLQVGDFIKYNNETWVVLHNNEEYGLQIVSRNAKTGINELSGKDGYSNAISLLNKECEKYMALGAEYARVSGTSPKFHMKGGTAEIDEFGMIAAVDNVEPDDNEDYASFINLMSEGKFSLDGAVITGARVFDERDGWREYQLSTILVTEQSYREGSIGFCRVSLNSGEVIEENYHYHGFTVDDMEEYGILPVIILNKNIQITGGDGSTLDTAYTYSFTNN